jgi:hypothetical protein
VVNRESSYLLHPATDLPKKPVNRDIKKPFPSRIPNGKLFIPPPSGPVDSPGWRHLHAAQPIPGPSLQGNHFMWHPGLQHVENVSHDKVTDLTASSPALLDNIIPIHIPLRNEFI